MTSQKTTLLKTVTHFIPYRICFSDQLKFEDWADIHYQPHWKWQQYFPLYIFLSLCFTSFLSFFLWLWFSISFNQDFVLYIMAGHTHVFGRKPTFREREKDRERERKGKRPLRVDTFLSAPDLLVRHLLIRRDSAIPEQARGQGSSVLALKNTTKYQGKE